MIVSEKLLKPISETAYLTAGNVHRYRAIIRFFYVQYEKMKYWMEQDEIFREMKRHQEFSEYTEDNCKGDLEQLKDWGNLIAVQDTSKVVTIEDFKNRKYRYQLSEYSVEIERMTLKLENLFIDGASLEPTLLERLRTELCKIETIKDEEDISIYAWWDMINNDFLRLNQNYQDYIRDLNSVKAEEMMKTAQFIVFKDKLVEYLRSFVISLQRNTEAIASILSRTRECDIQRIIDSVIRHEMNVPRLDIALSETTLSDIIRGRWDSIVDWFVGSDYTESSKLFEATSEIIRKITRYASQITEMHHFGINRREEYRKLCQMFLGCPNIDEAHKLSSVVFGVEKPIHLKGDFYRTTDSIQSRVYDEPAFKVSLSSKSRTHRQSTKRTGIRSFVEEKEHYLRQLAQKNEANRLLLQSYIKDNMIDFGHLPCITPEIRSTLLLWLSKGLELIDHSDKENYLSRKCRNEFGAYYYVDKSQAHNTCELKCSDGVFIMPNYRILFESTPPQTE